MRYEFEIDGIFVNPNLPDDFDITPNEEKDSSSLWWWGKPYIIIESLRQESWIEHYSRLKNEFQWSDERIGTQEDFKQNLQRVREHWFDEFHTGFRYNVRCLDGGSWDRSSNYGFFASFDEALSASKKLKDGSY